jgi:hypothetical protein
MATVALLDEFVQDVAGTLPQQMPQGPPPGPGVPLVLGDAVVMREASPLPGCERILVAARSDAAAELTFDVGALRGVPMARDGTLFRGAADVPTGGPAAVTVNARSPYGEKRTMEAGR